MKKFLSLMALASALAGSQPYHVGVGAGGGVSRAGATRKRRTRNRRRLRMASASRLYNAQRRAAGMVKR